MFRADENCNDYDVDSYPGAPEICEDDVDQNCDGGYSVQFSGFDLMGIPGNGDATMPTLSISSFGKMRDGMIKIAPAWI